MTLSVVVPAAPATAPISRPGHSGLVFIAHPFMTLLYCLSRVSHPGGCSWVAACLGYLTKVN